LRRTASFDVLNIKNRSNGFACRRVQEPKKCSKFRTGGVYSSPIWGAKPLGGLSPIFFWW